jgi:hypothetical protein
MSLASARLQKLERLCFRLALQFRQLGKNGRDALRLVAREQFAAESATRLLFKIYIGEGLPGQVFHHKITGSEIASACRELGLPVTLVERGSAPLVGALGGVLADRHARLQLRHGVDLRCQVTVTSLDFRDVALRPFRLNSNHGCVVAAMLNGGKFSMRPTLR